MGREVATLLDEKRLAGPCLVPLRVKPPNGIYHCQLTTDGQTTSRPMLVLP